MLSLKNQAPFSPAAMAQPCAKLRLNSQDLSTIPNHECASRLTLTLESPQMVPQAKAYKEPRVSITEPTWQPPMPYFSSASPTQHRLEETQNQSAVRKMEYISHYVTLRMGLSKLEAMRLRASNSWHTMVCLLLTFTKASLSSA